MLTLLVFGPNGPARGFLSRGGWLCLMLPLRLTTGARNASGGDIALLSFLHNECDIIHDFQPLRIMIRNNIHSVPIGRTALLPVPHVGTTPPGETQNDQENPLRTTGKDVGPC